MKKVIKLLGKTILLILCILLLFIFGIFIYHRIMLSKEKDLISEPPGEMIEVDGGRMCVYSEGSGEHTIVFMSGYGTPSPILDFKPLYDKLKDDFRIVVVEKFGYGFSDETDMSRDVDTMLHQTREALKVAGFEAPYILCPHSASGIEAIYWAQTYPEEIEGITALDITMPGYHEEAEDSILLDRIAKIQTNLGIIRLFADTYPYAYNSEYLTDEEKSQYKAIMYARRGSSTMLHEAECCKKNVDTISANPVPQVPMLFFTATTQASIVFSKNPKKYLTLARRYTDNKAEYIDLDCGHYVHVEEPDRVAAEIRRFADEIENQE